ncbi:MULTISPECIES: site-specific integrase [Flavobacterium]|uniref:site-specific integrase n=1 Tax=Flavobacterium TaxID=237 RepID=UPI000C463700|nr:MULTISPECIES: site-specific integrase [Flavobacterium]MBF00283.1 recombinase [Flavobacterium sp.]MBY8963201.1 site-specific integrase [Flavobacterium coralii]MCR5863466.1 site-specific integrase [Flavobacterium sp. J372]|tara:strand:- start:107221 stop:108534 length:1314 start_codon:yes stop_codon:yes gene_type:complete
MLESSFGLTFFLRTPRRKTNIRSIYLRITVDGIPKETSIKCTWDLTRWDQKTERATGSKEDARVLNNVLDAITVKVNKRKADLIYAEETITAQKLIDYVKGKVASRAKVLEEFQLHNDEVKALVPKEYSAGTLERFVTAKSHVRDFIKFKYRVDDLEFRELNFQFVKDYEFYLKTVKGCCNNTTLKYISNFKKIVLRAIAKEIITVDPFKLFKGKKTKTNKKPLSREELLKIERHSFSTPRLELVRDIFVFQCYTGLAYIDVFNLKASDIKTGIDGEPWIMTERQKTGSETNVPLLPQALEIMSRYKGHPLSEKRGAVLPVKSNQKMNAYLKEIADLCGINCELNTHKARRTFASTVTLGNNVPIHVVKEMLGHHSIQQTEEYAITEKQSISREMQGLRHKFAVEKASKPEVTWEAIHKLENELQEMKMKFLTIQSA